MAEPEGKPVLPIVGGALVVAAAIALLVQSWTSQQPIDRRGHSRAEPAAAAARDHDHGHAMAALYDVNDPAQVLNQPAGQAPGVALAIASAADGGLDLTLTLANFQFAPADAAGQHVAGQGHAHLYVDGAYIADFAAPTYHLNALAPGAHEIAVGLNTIDHRAYARDGTIVAERISVRLGDGRRRAAPLTVPRAFDVMVRGGKASADAGDTLRVKQGDTVRLNWASDAPMTLHLEGYDIEAQVAPQSPAAMLFVADLPGRFPVEQHGEGGAHGRGAVLYVEVYP